jgi:radical SAM superfamily enzyme YgiQ (UPF0313 family)
MRIVFVDNLLLENANGLTQYVLQPHLGLISLIAVAEACGHEALLYDPKLALWRGELMLDESLYHDAAKQILAMQPDAVGMTSLGCNFICTVKIAAYLKDWVPDLPIMLGGPHASVLDRQIATKFPQFDVIVRNEAEVKLPSVLRALGTRSFWGVPGVTFRRRSDIFSNPGDPIIEDLDSIPIPAYFRYPIKELGLTSLRVDAGRGCPFSCTFCSTASFFGRRYRLKSAERLIQELDLLRDRYGIRDFALTHDLFTVNRRKVLEFCEAVRGRGYTWKCSARMDCVDDEMLRAMSRAGCQSIYYGIETGSRRMQGISKKRLDLELFQPTLDITQSVGMSATVSFITGYPEEDQGDQNATLNMIGGCFSRGGPPLNVQLHLLTPEPGTQLMKEYGNRIEFDGHISDFNFPTLEPDDPVVMAGEPQIFVNHHYFPTFLPRQRHVFVTSVYQVLYELGFDVLNYALQFYGGKLSALIAAMYGWAVENGRVRSPDTEFVESYIGARWGEDHVMHSLARYMFALARLRKNVSDTLSANRSHAQPPAVLDGRCDEASVYARSPAVAVVTNIYDCPRILAFLARNRVKSTSVIPRRLRRAKLNLLLVLSGGSASSIENFSLSDGGAALITYFEAPRSYEDFRRTFRQETGLPLPRRAFFSQLLREGVLCGRAHSGKAHSPLREPWLPVKGTAVTSPASSKISTSQRSSAS